MPNDEQQDPLAGFREAMLQAGPQSADMLQLVMTKTIGLAMHNAIATQQNAQITAAAMVSATCADILSIGRRKPILLQPKPVAAKNTTTTSVAKKASASAPGKKAARKQTEKK